MKKAGYQQDCANELSVGVC